jgi:tight adherence protein C
MLAAWLPTIAFAFTATVVFLVGQVVTSRFRTQALGDPDLFAVRNDQPSALVKTLALLIPDLALGRAEGLDRDLGRAGFYRPHARIEFLAARNLMLLCGFGVWILAFVILADRGPVILSRVLLAGIFGIGGLYIIPRLFLVMRGSQRVQKILEGLPDALDIIKMCVDGGLPIEESLDRVTPRIRDVHPELAAEFDIVQRQASLGAVGQGLSSFADRVDEPDLHALVEVVQRAELAGADVGSAMSDYATNIRENLRLRAERLGNLMSVKLLFPIMFCLAPAAYMLLLAPAVVELRQFMITENQPGGALDISSAQNSIRRPITGAQPYSATEQAQIAEQRSALQQRANTQRPATTGNIGGPPAPRTAPQTNLGS